MTTEVPDESAMSGSCALTDVESALSSLYAGIDFGVGDLTYLSVMDKRGLTKDFWSWQEPNEEEMKSKLTALGINHDLIWPTAQEFSSLVSIGRKELLADIKASTAEHKARRRQFRPIRTTSARKRKALRSANYAKEYAMVYLTNYRLIKALVD